MQYGCLKFETKENLFAVLNTLSPLRLLLLLLGFLSPFLLPLMKPTHIIPSHTKNPKKLETNIQYPFSNFQTTKNITEIVRV